MLTVLLSQGLRPEAMEMLEGRFRLIIPELPGQEAFDALAPEAEAIILRTNVKITPELLESAKRLKIICRTGAGVDNVPLEAAAEKGILVTNTPDANSISVAEHAVSMALSIFKCLPDYERSLRKGDWSVRASNRSSELAGKTAGIIGMGKIGSHTAKILHGGFQMSVVYHDPFVNPESLAGYTAVFSLEELFECSDVIFLHCPSNVQTRGIVNQRLLSHVKRGAVLINCARGDIVDEAALCGALRDGVLAAAGLDVFASEPIRSENPLLQLDNVLATPHCAALTREASVKMATGAVKCLIEFNEGLIPRNVVMPGQAKGGAI